MDDGSFSFPTPFPLEKRLKDALEDSVETKYYVDPERVKTLIPQMSQKQIESIVRGGKPTSNVIKVGCTGTHQKDGVYDPEGISTTLLASHCKQPIQIVERNK